MRSVSDRRFNEEDNEGRNVGPPKGQAERRVESVRAKKPAKSLKHDKLHPEREGRADSAVNGAGQGDEMGEREVGDGGEGERQALGGSHEGGDSSLPFPSSFPSDIRVRDRDREDHSAQSTSNIRATSSLVAESNENEPHSNMNTNTSSVSYQEGTETRSSTSMNCRYFSKGHCVFGSKCHFIHSGLGGKVSSNIPMNQERDPRDGGEEAEGSRGERGDKNNRVLPGRGKDRGVGGREGNVSGRGRGGRGPKKQSNSAPGSSNDEGITASVSASQPVSESVAPPPAPVDSVSTDASHDAVAPNSTAASSS